MACAQKSLRHVLYRGRVLAVQNGFQRRSTSFKTIQDHWNATSLFTKTTFGFTLAGAVYFGGEWCLDRLGSRMDHDYKQTTGTRLALEAKEEYEQLKYHLNESKIPQTEHLPVRIDRSDLHLKMAQHIADKTLNLKKPRVIIISGDKGLGKSTSFKAGAKLFVEALRDPEKHPSIKILDITKDFGRVFTLYLNFEEGPKSALRELGIYVKSDLDAIEALSYCFTQAKANNYCVVLLLDAPGGVLKKSTLDVQQRFRRMCKSVTGSGFGRIYAVTSPAGVAVFTDGTELNDARRELYVLDWFKASENEKLMMIDGYIKSAKEGKAVTVEKGETYEETEVMSKYQIWQNEAAFVNGNIDQISTFLDKKF